VRGKERKTRNAFGFLEKKKKKDGEEKQNERFRALCVLAFFFFARSPSCSSSLSFFLKIFT